MNYLFILLSLITTPLISQESETIGYPENFTEEEIRWLEVELQKYMDDDDEYSEMLDDDEDDDDEESDEESPDSNPPISN
jgi:hypothetical protein